MQIQSTDGPPLVRGAVRYEARFPSTVDRKDETIRDVIGVLTSGGVSGDSQLYRFRLCLDEAVQNAIDHGNRGDGEKTVRVSLYESEESWELLVSDEGEGFSPAEALRPAGSSGLLEERGRGLRILIEYMDEVAWFDGGRTAYLRARRR